jgi:hypothetical protein
LINTLFSDVMKGCNIYKEASQVLIPEEDRRACYMPFRYSSFMFFGGCYNGWIAPWCYSPEGAWGICDPDCSQGILETYGVGRQ